MNHLDQDKSYPGSLVVVGLVFITLLVMVPIVVLSPATDPILSRLDRLVPLLTFVNTLGIAYLCVREARRR